MVLVQKVFIEPFNFSFFSITGQGIDLDYCAIDGLPWKWITKIVVSLPGSAYAKYISVSTIEPLQLSFLISKMILCTP